MANDTEEEDSSTASDEATDDRGMWTGKMEFLCSCLSYAVGLGNLWRFPYLCYRNGGGAFLIPYGIMLVFAGIPLFFMETAFGQFASEGVITIWKVSPIFQGIGWGMLSVSCLIAIYYNIVIAWSLRYLIASFQTSLPWRACENGWNTPACGSLNVAKMNNCTTNNGVWYNYSCVLPGQLSTEQFLMLQNVTKNFTIETDLQERKSASDEFFHNSVLDISDGLHNMGPVVWQLALCLLFAWVLVAICLIKGIKSSGKAVYFTASFPYLVLLILLVRGATLPGADRGILYFLTPQWGRLLTAKVWGDAAVQIFFSLSPCWGGLITLASYNRFKNNCLRDALFVSIGNCGTSIFAGFVIFAIIGFMAHEMQLPVEMVAKGGAGLAFVVYPEVVSKLPISPLWAVLFFLMLITLGLGTQFTVVTTVHTTLLDVFPSVLRRGYRPMILMLTICVCGYFMGLLCTTQGGMYMLQLIDTYAATYSVLIIGFCECMALTYVYGIDRFLANIEMMLGNNPSIWWKIVWKYITPPLLVFIIIFTWIDFKPSNYGSYQYPTWADVLGWMLSMTSVIPIPVVIVVKIVQRRLNLQQNESLKQTIVELSKPSADWGPRRVQLTCSSTDGTASGIQTPLNQEHSSVEVVHINENDTDCTKSPESAAHQHFSLPQEEN